jgi:hypothetical protein
MTHAQLPYHVYVNVDNSALGPNMPEGSTPAIWHGVHSRPGQLIMAHLMLDTGAHWSGVPLHSISTKGFEHGPSDLMPWGAMGDSLITVHFGYLEGLVCAPARGGVGHGRHTGIVVDWADGYSRYPQEHKPLNLVALDSGQFALLPNNYLLFEDAHFVSALGRENLRFYRRAETVHWE